MGLPKFTILSSTLCSDTLYFRFAFVISLLQSLRQRYAKLILSIGYTIQRGSFCRDLRNVGLLGDLLCRWSYVAIRNSIPLYCRFGHSMDFTFSFRCIISRKKKKKRSDGLGTRQGGGEVLLGA